MIQILYKLQKKWGGRNVFQPILKDKPYPDTIRKDIIKKKMTYKYVINKGTKILNKMLANPIQQYIKRIMHMMSQWYLS